MFEKYFRLSLFGSSRTPRSRRLPRGGTPRRVSRSLRLESLEQRQLLTIEPVSAVFGAITADGPSFLDGAVERAVSADGRFVVFTSNAPDFVPPGLDLNNASDVFLYDRSNLSVTLISRENNATGVTSDGASFAPMISDDGRVVTFLSTGANLVPGQIDGNLTADLFRFDVALGETTLISHARGSAATAGDGAVLSATMDSAGATIAFESLATNLVIAGDGNAAADVFLWRDDVLTPGGLIERVSQAAATGLPGNARSFAPVINGTGRLILFNSDATNILASQQDANAASDVFLYNVLSHATTLVSSAGGSPSITANGSSRVEGMDFFGHFAVLTTDATNLATVVDLNAGGDVYLFDTESLAMTLVSHAAGAPSQAAGAASSEPQISGDGRFVAFTSTAPNVAPGVTDVGGFRDVFVYDRLTGSSQLVSHRPGLPTTPATGNSSAPVLSGDGRYVAFQSLAANLVAGMVDANGGLASDVFVWDRGTDVMNLASQSEPVPATTGDAASTHPAISRNGLATVFNSNATNLFLSDINAASDVFVFTAVGPNNAPVLDPLVAPSIDVVAPLGTAVDDILSVAGLYSDADGTLSKGIAIVGQDETHGVWEYTTDGGDSWVPLGSTSNLLAVLLSADGAGQSRVRFLPANPATFSGVATFNFRGWDGTDGNLSGFIDINVSVNGLQFAYSAETALAVAAAPTNVAPTVASFAKTALQNAVQSFTLLDFAAALSDADGDTLKIVKIVSLPANGTLTQAGVPVVAGQKILAADLASLAYQGDIGFVGPDSFTWDGSDGLLYSGLPALVNMTVELDETSPTVTIGQAIGQADPTDADTIHFTVVFSEPVFGFDETGVTLSGTAGATFALVTTTDNVTFDVAVSGMIGDGTVVATVAAGVAQDAAFNLSEASTSTDNTVVYDIALPDVSIDQAAGQADPTNLAPVHFTVVFSEPVFGFDGTDIVLSGTAGATTALISTTDNVTFDVAVSGMPQSGTVVATVAAGGAQDAAGNLNTASTSTDNTVVFVVGPVPQLLTHSQTFAAGKPGFAQGWEYFSTNQGRIQVVGGQLRMDDSVNNTVSSLNEAILHVNLTGRVEVQLQLDHQSSLDANSAFAGTQFAGHVNADLMAVSLNGVNWVKVTALTTSFVGRMFALDTLLQQAALAAGSLDMSNVRIKFQQYDRGPWGTDGRGFDNIRVTGALPVPRTIPHTQNFSAGKPGPSLGWEYYATNQGRVQVVSGQLRMDDSVNNAVFSLNEAILHVNLAGRSSVQLRLDHTNAFDENNLFAGTQFTGHRNADLIAVSVNGTNWVKVTDLTTSFTGRTFALDTLLQQAALAAGSTSMSNVRIKLQQYDNGPWGIDGRTFDNIQVTAAVSPLLSPAAGLAGLAADLAAPAAGLTASPSTTTSFNVVKAVDAVIAQTPASPAAASMSLSSALLRLLATSPAQPTAKRLAPAATDLVLADGLTLGTLQL